jgi:hypothetical protein
MLLRLVRLALFPSVASTTLCFGFRDPSACSGETARTNSSSGSACPSSPTARTAGSGRRCTTRPVEQVKGILAERRQTSTDEAFEAFRLYARARQLA